ncbi:MAG: arginine--tRNA ligase [Lachnospiraceae bacterium]|nr:arginine--tRNA ligase [Lachnospiraceae bacterium]
MKNLADQMTAAAAQAFAACGYDASYAKISLSNRPDLCEYQCNGALAAAKAYRENPMNIAEKVAEKLKESPIFGKAEAVRPGFLNLDLSAGALAEALTAISESETLGSERIGEGRTILLDYGGANVAKPLHVGHLRSAIIGESLKRICRFLGFEAIGDVHLGDWGLQMGLIIEALRDEQPELPYFDEAFTGPYPAKAPFTISDLERIYPAASARAKTDEAFSARAHEATFRLQQGHPGYTALFRHIVGVSREDLKKNYDALDVHFDLWKGESDAQPYIGELLAILEEKQLTERSEGALVVPVAKESDTKEVPPCLIQKSDGAYLYATTDLATIIEREKLYHPDEYLYITDKRQAMHFEQVFRVAKKAGIVREETKLGHLGFGTMNGKDGKPFKTRSGGVMRLEYLLRDIRDAVLERMAETNLPEEEKQETAAVIGLAALKYGDLSNQATKDYVFDLERFSSFEGNTGPYILYTIVRIRSILRRLAESGTVPAQTAILPAGDAAEKALQLQLTRFAETVRAAYEEKAPHKLCQFIYELANVFNSFYRDHHILKEEDKARQSSWIGLLQLTEKELNTMIGLLGFEAPERM